MLGLAVVLVLTVGTIPATAQATVAPALTGVSGSLHSDDSFTASISGQITGENDPDGLPNASVEVYSSDGSFLGTEDTNQAGGYSITGLPAGVYILEFDDFYDCTGCDGGEYEPQYWINSESIADATPISVSDGQQVSDVGADLSVYATISGNVTGLIGTHSHVPDIVQVLAFDNTGHERVGFTDSDGNYTIPGLASGPYKLEFDAAGTGYATQWYDGKTSLGTGGTVTVPRSEQMTGIDQVLQQSSSISGHMTDSHGRPLAGSVEIYASGDSSGDETDSLVGGVSVNRDGSYSVTGLHTGTYKVGFTTVRTVISPSLVGAKPTAFQSKLSDLEIAPPVYSGGPTTIIGSLAPSYPYRPRWYSGGTSYETATDVVISTPGQAVHGVNASLIYDPTFLQTWPGEMIGGANFAENLCQCHSGDPVNTATGEFYNNATDLSIAGNGAKFDVERGYSSSDASVDGPFGYGWSASFSSHLDVLTPGTDGAQPSLVQVTQENGSTVQFSLDVNGNYVAPPRVKATLTYNGFSQWTFTRLGTEVMKFDDDGKITSTQDLNGNTVAYDYIGSEIYDMTTTDGRTFHFIWSSGHVVAISDGTGRSVNYGYDDNGNLTSFTAADYAVTTFGYDDNHYLTTTTSPNGGVTTNAYDPSHRVTSQTDAVGRVTTMAYDVSGASTTTTTTRPDGSQKVENYTDGLLSSTTAAAGTSDAETTTYVYDDADNVVKSTDPMGHSTTFTYDENGNKLTEADPLDHVTTWTYDQLNDVTSMTDPLGRITTSDFDDAGNKLDTTSPSGRVQQWTYNGDGTVASSTDGRGLTTTYTYDDAGRQTGVTDPDHRTTSTAYNSDGFVISVTKPGGRVTFSDVDALGRVLDTTDPDHQTTDYYYDSDGNLTSTVTPDRHTTKRTYDLADQLKTQIDPYGKKTIYSYTGAGQLASVTDPDGDKTKYTYNAAGQKTATIDPDGRRTAYHYDLDGRSTATYLPSGAHTTNQYNAASQKIGTTDADGKTTTYTYDAAGELSSTTDPLGRVTAQTYTDDGQVAVITLPDSSSETYAYDKDGNTIRFVNADGKATTSTFTLSGQMSSQTQPGGLKTSYRYNTAGLLYITTKPDGSTLTDTYNGDGSLTRVSSSVSGSADITYAYTESNQRKSMTDVTGTTTYTYDRNGRLISDQDGAGQSLSYTYGNEGQLLSITYPGSKTVTYTYDPAGQMTSLTDWSNNHTTFTWTADGKLATQVDPNGVTETRAYDSADQTTGIATAKSGSTLADYTYGYDDAGDINTNSTTDPIGATSSGDSYDPNGQLTTVTTGTDSSTYAATSAGELTSTTDGTTLAYNSSQELASITPATGAATNYSYDDNGSRISSTVTGTDTTPAAITNYVYDPEDNLTSVTLPDATPATVSYTSDGDGLRQTRTDGGTTSDFLWDLSNSLPLLLSDGAHSYLYGPSSAPLAQVDNSTSTVQYLHADIVGSTRLITDSTGAVVGTTEYDPYGKRTNHTGTADSAIGYSGNWTDSHTGLVYLRARDYDPSTLQFLVVDPAVGMTREAYEYASNNPLLDNDLTGLADWWNPGSWSAQTWQTIGTVALVVGFVALAATGVGLAADGAGILIAGGIEGGSIAAGSGLAALGTVAETTGDIAAGVAYGAGGFTAGADWLSCGFHDKAACGPAVLDSVGLGFGGYGTYLSRWLREDTLGFGVGLTGGLPPAITGFGIDWYEYQLSKGEIICR